MIARREHARHSRDPRALTERVEEAVLSIAHADGYSRLRDPDGHSLTLSEP
ncbi:hypothetical protein [Halomicrobium katesii]|uniref:hypothetical protein n=1 Tax=Halomicrobium katesii TaxID=437163 RepID=UPI000380EEFA|nr:hypothetical protein [Halomicrobium katesii]